jgi:hypothetical protein
MSEVNGALDANFYCTTEARFLLLPPFPPLPPLPSIAVFRDRIKPKVTNPMRSAPAVTLWLVAACRGLPTNLYAQILIPKHQDVLDIMFSVMS